MKTITEISFSGALASICIWCLATAASAVTSPVQAHQEKVSIPQSMKRKPGLQTKPALHPLPKRLADEPAPAPTNKIRMDFREAQIIQVVRLLSELSGINIVATEKAGEVKASIFLQDVTVEGALDAVCKAAGLWYRKDERTGVWRVMTLEEYQRDIVVYRAEHTKVLTLRNSNVVAAANAVAALFGARVKLTTGVEETVSTSGLNASGSAPGTSATSSAGSGGGGAASAADTAPTGTGRKLSAGQVSGALDQFVSATTENTGEARLANTVIEPPAIRITTSRQHNLLIVRTSDMDALREVESLIREIDLPTRQVLLEMRILEVTLGDDFRSVFDFGLNAGNQTSPPPIGQSGNPFVKDAISGATAQLGLGNNLLEGGTFVFQLMNKRVMARIQMLETQNRVRVLSTPLVLTSNNQPARLFIGEERVLVTGVTANTTTNANQTFTTFTSQTEKRNIGNTLVLVPRINADRTVTLAIQQDASTVLPKSTSIPVGSSGSIQSFDIDSVNTANLQVTVVAKDQLTVAVGGMIRERASNAETKVPLLGDIPVLGNLFKRIEKSDGKTEMVLLVTPYILESPEESAQRTRERGSALTGRSDLLSTPQPGTGTSPPDVTERAARLTRHAALASTNAPLASQQNPDIQSEAITLGEYKLLGPDGPAGRVVAAWRQGDLYVTTLTCTNSAAEPIQLELHAIRGQWISATPQNNTLGPAGSAEASTLIHLVSDQPFAKAIQPGLQP